MRIKASAVASLVSDGFFRLTITDESSRIQFVELKMTPEQFAFILSARVTTDIECEVYGLGGVGKVRETKTERIPFDPYRGGSAAKRGVAAQQALAPFEVDGWKGRIDHLLNRHRSDTVERGVQLVTFERLVERKEGGA